LSALFVKPLLHLFHILSLLMAGEHGIPIVVISCASLALVLRKDAAPQTSIFIVQGASILHGSGTYFRMISFAHAAASQSIKRSPSQIQKMIDVFIPTSSIIINQMPTDKTTPCYLCALPTQMIPTNQTSTLLTLVLV
jgi:hypothetical protein